MRLTRDLKRGEVKEEASGLTACIFIEHLIESGLFKSPLGVLFFLLIKNGHDATCGIQARVFLKAFYIKYLLSIAPLCLH